VSAPILVTGGSGQLALALDREARARDVPVRRVGRPDFDFDRPASIDAAFAGAAPWLVVNAAAYTAVDAAETDPEAAFRANRDGPARLAALCEAAGIPLIHVSTDYVFTGTKHAPYIETDPTGPIGVYGASKLAGEQAALAACRRALILRTAWVYSAGGKNFLLTMLNAARRTNRLRVVADQRGSPTTAADLAAAILDIAARLREADATAFAGIYHACGAGSTSWYGFAEAIFEEAARYGVPVPSVEPIRTEDWPTPAKRPPDSRLDCGKLARSFGVRFPPWRDSLARTIAEVFTVSATNSAVSVRP
jgi:dTDP-4-dehydrorhamnose reductase